MTEEIVLPASDEGERNSIEKLMDKLQSREFTLTIVHTIISIILALGVAAIIIQAAGYNPGQAYSALLLGAILNFDQVLWRATPLILAGLSVALAFKCGLFNIGAEGQLYMGSIAATAIGYMIALPLGLHAIACMAVGVIAGLLYGLLPGILRAYRGAHEVVTTMMLSYIAVGITQWLVTEGPMNLPGDTRSVSPVINDFAFLPKLFGSPYVSWAFVIALLCVPLVNFFINKTVMGMEMRAVGLNEDAARTAGINAKKNMALALGLSGALAGLAGAVEVQGYYHRFYDGWSGGLGFDGITVAVLGRNSPWGVLGGSLFFGALKAGGIFMQTSANVPKEIVQVIQSLVVLFVAAPRLIDWFAEKGNGYANWIKNNLQPGIFSVLSLGYGILGSFVGFLVIGPIVLGEFSVVLLGLLLSMGSLLLVVYNLRIDERCASYSMGIGVLWLIMAVAGFSLNVISIVSTSLIMMCIGFVIAFLMMKVESDKHNTQEGEI
ncbi:MAG: ABC transporter permease [Candidatus Thorarchaeota archaeon]